MSRPSAQPNIVLILADEQRWDTLGCYGQSLPVTPHLDRMAATGVCFTNAFSCQPLCGPARSCIQTGRYASETGCIANNIALPSQTPTIAHTLADAGYETAYIGKWHLASNSHEGDECYWTRPIPPERRGGWEYWLAAEVPEYTSHSTAGWLFDGAGRQVTFTGQYRADAYTDYALEYLHRREDDRPFALLLSLVEPHAQPYHRLYQGPPAERRRFEYREITYEGPDAWVARFADAPLPPDLSACPGCAHEFWPDYLAACARVDWNVGRVFDTLETLGLRENTCVLYTSDHGCHFFSRLPAVAKCTAHESSIRVPLLACGPGFPRGVQNDALVSLIDVAPTILTAAGIEPPAAMRGMPVQQVIGNGISREAVYIELPGPAGAVAVRTPRWKLVASPRDGTLRGEALYDLQADTREVENLIADVSLHQVINALVERLTAMWREVRDTQ